MTNEQETSIKNAIVSLANVVDMLATKTETMIMATATESYGGYSKADFRNTVYTLREQIECVRKMVK